MRAAWHLAHRKLDDYFSKYSRHDFTLPQLFACLVIREMLGLSYRKLEQFLRDSSDWIADLGMSRVPDHNTLCRAAHRLLKEGCVKRLLDEQVAWAVDADAGALMQAVGNRQQHVRVASRQPALRTSTIASRSQAQKGRQIQAKTHGSLPSENGDRGGLPQPSGSVDLDGNWNGQ